MSQPFVPNMRPNTVQPPSRALYTAMGADNIYKMLSDFYAALGRSPIADMFPRDLERASRKSAAFFIGLFGGPPLYHQQYGPPRMRARHMPFPITYDARQAWLDCWEEVLVDAPAQYDFPADELPGFRAFLDGFSEWMVNTGPAPSAESATSEDA